MDILEELMYNSDVDEIINCAPQDKRYIMNLLEHIAKDFYNKGIDRCVAEVEDENLIDTFYSLKQ